MSRANFITFEGIEGSGKTTQIQLLAEHLRERGHALVLTREPGGTTVGERLRDVLLDPTNQPTPLAELLILEAARAQVVAEVIAPALANGIHVLCDRFSDSSLAYQGGGRGLDPEMISGLSELACNGVVPDRTLILDLPVEKALTRARHRSSTTAANRRFEDEELHFHHAVAAAFRALALHAPTRVRLVDAQGTAGEVHLRVLNALAGVLS
jgi:dTMP kinase